MVGAAGERGVKRSGDLEGLGGALRRVVGRLGMGDLDVLLELQADWDGLAGRPWAGTSRVVGIERGTVVVQAFEAGSVSFLRYGEAALLEAIEERFGPGVATSVKVIAPPRGSSR